MIKLPDKLGYYLYLISIKIGDVARNYILYINFRVHDFLRLEITVVII